MRLTEKALNNLIIKLVGEEGVRLINKLKKRDNFSEFTLANQLRRSINQVRNLLYKLQEHNLVSFTRKKDKKKGWYIYYWTFDKSRAKEVILSMKKDKLSRLKKELDRIKDTILFICPNGCVEEGFEEAMSNDFKCMECGKLLEQEDNEEKIEKLKKKIKELEKEISKN